MNHEIEVYTDGACVVQDKIGGIGAVIVEHNKLQHKLSGVSYCATNNRMEVMALLYAVRYINEQYGSNIKSATFYSDSTYVVNGVLGMRQGVSKYKKNLDIWRAVNDALKGLFCTYKILWVRAHSDNHWNNIADNLAKIAMKNLADPLKVPKKEK